MLKRLKKGKSKANEDFDTRRDAFYAVGLILFYCEDYESFLNLIAGVPASGVETEN